MIEQRVFCDRCKSECSDDYVAIDLVKHHFEESYTTKEIIHLCSGCFGYLDGFLNADFSIPIEDDV